MVEMNCVCGIAGMAKRVVGGNRAKRHQDMGDGALSQDQIRGLQKHKQREIQVLC